MYTVLRVLSDDPALDLTPLVDAVNIAGAVPPLTRMAMGRGYVTEVCDLPSWDSHVSALHAAAIALRSSLLELSRYGARVVVDVAVGPEDRSREWLLLDITFPPDLLAALSAAGIHLVVSFYAGTDPDQ
jgi:hypothetical protein